MVNVADPYSGINPFGFGGGRGGGIGGSRLFPNYQTPPTQLPPRPQSVGTGNKLPVPFRSRSLCESIHGACQPAGRGEWMPRSPLVGGKPLPTVVNPRAPIEGQVVGGGKRAIDHRQGAFPVPAPRSLPKPTQPTPQFTGPTRPTAQGRGPQGPGRRDYADNIWRSKGGQPVKKSWCRENPKACTTLIAGGAYLISDQDDEPPVLDTQPPTQPVPTTEPPTQPPEPPVETQGIFGDVRDWMTDPTLTTTGLSNAENLSRLGQLLSYATGTNTRSQPAAWTDPSKNPARQWAKDEYYRSQSAQGTKWAFCDPNTGRCFNKTTGQWEMPPNVTGTTFTGKRPEPTTGDKDVAKSRLAYLLNVDELTDSQKWDAGAIADKAKTMSEMPGSQMTYQEAVDFIIKRDYAITPESLGGTWFIGSEAEVEQKRGTSSTAIKAPPREIKQVSKTGEFRCSYDNRKTWGACR